MLTIVQLQALLLAIVSIFLHINCLPIDRAELVVDRETGEDGGNGTDRRTAVTEKLPVTVRTGLAVEETIGPFLNGKTMWPIIKSVGANKTNTPRFDGVRPRTLFGLTPYTLTGWHPVKTGCASYVCPD